MARFLPADAPKRVPRANGPLAVCRAGVGRTSCAQESSTLVRGCSSCLASVVQCLILRTAKSSVIRRSSFLIGGASDPGRLYAGTLAKHEKGCKGPGPLPLASRVAASRRAMDFGTLERWSARVFELCSGGRGRSGPRPEPLRACTLMVERPASLRARAPAASEVCQLDRALSRSVNLPRQARASGRPH